MRFRILLQKRLNSIFQEIHNQYQVKEQQVNVKKMDLYMFQMR